MGVSERKVDGLI